MQKYKTQICTITIYDAPNKFSSLVNGLLEDGWEIYGPPTISAVPRFSTIDGRPSSSTEVVYSQVLKRVVATS